MELPLADSGFHSPDNGLDHRDRPSTGQAISLSSPRIPVEVIERVIDFVDSSNELQSRERRRTLRACALSSRYLLPRSRAHLFRQLEVRKRTEFQRLIDTVISSPIIAQIPRSVVIGEFKIYAPPGFSSWLGSTLFQLPSLFPAVSTLKLVSFDEGPNMQNPRMPIMLSQFVSITELRLTLCSFDSFDSLRRTIISFRNLVTLEMNNNYWETRVPRLSVHQYPHRQLMRLREVEIVDTNTETLFDLFSRFLANPLVLSLDSFSLKISLSSYGDSLGWELEQATRNMFLHLKDSLETITYRITDQLQTTFLERNLFLEPLRYLRTLKLIQILPINIPFLVPILPSLNSRHPVDIYLAFYFEERNSPIEVDHSEDTGWKLMDEKWSDEVAVSRLSHVYIVGAFQTPWSDEESDEEWKPKQRWTYVEFEELQAFLPRLSSFGLIKPWDLNVKVTFFDKFD